MAKLYFRYGTVNSSKTMNLLAVVHNYQEQGKTCLLMKPSCDTRTKTVYSRTGLERQADLLLEHDTDIINYLQSLNKKIDCIVIDEAQFLSAKNIGQLRSISANQNIPVIAYGLRTNFLGKFFEGSLLLMELADSLEEIKNTCKFCNKKATMNLKLQNGKATFNGNPVIDVGFEDKYIPVCYPHYENELKETLEITSIKK